MLSWVVHRALGWRLPALMRKKGSKTALLNINIDPARTSAVSFPDSIEIECDAPAQV
tara:strand:- start:635 stop:805 length:171 start_codon:yes stop_codon:yes gene_type:complete